MKPRILVLFAGLVLVAGVGRAFAHHAFSATYDSDQRIEIEGVVTEFVWRNPHSFLRVDVKDEGGEMQTWNLEWGSVGQLSRSVSRTTLRPGDHVIVAGNPGRHASNRRLRIVSVTRPVDGWSWQGQID